VDYKTIDQAMAFVRRHMARNNGEVPDWARYQQLVKHLLWDPDLPRKFKMPREYHYAYLRGKGLSDAEARARMGLEDGSPSRPPQTESSWAWLKFWQ
jgi:hypothetical protein